MIQNIRKNLKWFFAIIVLACIGSGVGLYILNEQRLRFPILEEKPIRMSAWLDDASSVTPGQGQTVQVAGVTIGDIASVKLVDGRAKVGLDIQPKYVRKGLIREDATAMLRPRTALKDMYIQVFPGSQQAPAAKRGFEVPLSRTMTDVDLDEILSTLDPRVRDYLQLFANGAGRGLRRRGDDLAEVFARYAPTVKDLARVNRSVARQRTELRSLITSFARLNERLAERPEDLSQLVTESEETFSAFASEDDNLRATVSELPETLRVLRETLRDVTPFAQELGPATRSLVPVTQALERSAPEVRRLAREATPQIRTQIRPFIREARPLVSDLSPAARALAQAFPELRRTTSKLNTFFNMAAFNPEGREDPGKRDREEGYLFWLGWTGHQGANLINIDDANGPMRPIFLTGTCTTLTGLVNGEPELEFAMGLSPILAALCGNPSTASVRDGGKPLATSPVTKGGAR